MRLFLSLCFDFTFILFRMSLRGHLALCMHFSLYFSAYHCVGVGPCGIISVFSFSEYHCLCIVPCACLLVLYFVECHCVGVGPCACILVYIFLRGIAWALGPVLLF